MVDNVQTWLEDNYTDNKRDVTEINSKGKELEGKLELKDFPELQVVQLSDSKEITEITIKNCPKIYCLRLSNNKIGRLTVTDSGCLKEMQWVDISHNPITSLDFAVKLFPNLLVLTCVDVQIVGQRVNGSVTSNLVHYAGGIGSEKPNYWSAEHDYKERLKKIARSLGVRDSDLNGKSTSDIERSIRDKATQNSTASEEVKTLKKENAELKRLLEKYVGNPQQSAKIAVPPKA